ncbi:hypothetical protein MJA45_02440 [Paenibacillus aurantius]|uniref:Uncharacterized protein n=1 Tax=Paenibacillus aurantius TaxID=2918900 RepID=A0AA96RFF5_9BACL|nr:hypothetical protein [Paenibacillus aurantius]WNQ11937.1 hypothetical protein MJA45_02440 [Paenibacillus aurantius]
MRSLIWSLSVLIIISLLGCSNSKVNTTELNEVKEDITSRITDFKKEGLVVYSVYVDQEKNKVIVEVKEITEERRQNLIKEYGPNKVDFVKGEKINPS